MSGIVALFDRSGAGIATERLEAMHEQIAHRGPDGAATWCDDRVALGHQQLQATPEAEYDDQPARSQGDVIAADARLDNRGELLDLLSVSESPGRVPDSQLLLAAYQRWGTACVERLAGSFAFVIRDDDADQLFCARDHFGVKPFYYHQTPDVFAVASEKKGLLCLPSVPGRVDETKLGDFLLDTYEDTERSFFESIGRLQPAHAMTVTPEETTRWRYWDLDPTRTVTLDSDAAYARRFRELFEQAVQSRLRSPGPVGAALSGGLDSTSVTVVARELLPEAETLHTFSNVFDEAASSDEREFIETVIDRDGIESHYVCPEGVGSLPDESELWEYFDQPPHNTMHFSGWERTKSVSAAGVSVFLGGALGDSACGYGLGMLPELLWTGRWRALYRELSAMGEVLDTSAKRLFVNQVVPELVPEPVRKIRRRYKGYLSPIEQANPTLDAGFVDDAGLRDRYARQTNRGAMITPRARRQQRRSLLTGKNTTNFETLDLLHAAFGIEPRYPFTDVRLVEFSLAIPATQQLSNGWTRSIVRRALGDLLPEKIQWRPWKTFVNEAFWNALDSELDRIESLASDPGPLSRYLDPDSLRESHERFVTNRNSRDARALWRALSLSAWFDAYAPRIVHDIE